MAKKLFLIHTVNQFRNMIYEPFAVPFEKANNDIEIYNIMDDTLLKETLANGGITNGVCSRILNYVKSAAEAGADCVMCTCTSVNAAAKYARNFAPIPFFNIDEPVARETVKNGKKIGVLATLPTSPKGTVRLLNEEAQKQNKDIEIVTSVAEGAFDALTAGDVKKHDEMVTEALFKLAKEVDTITFAQISMSKLVHDDPGVPIYKIGASGFEEAKKILMGQG
ncbi:MAG: aspartate/glutamate racemase family protein [Eubacteriales bacterium]